MRSVERDYPVIRQEGTLRLIAGNDFLSDDQSEIYDAAIQELARDLRQKSGLRVEIVPPDSIDLQFKPLGQLSTGKIDLFIYSSIYDAAIDNREYRHFAEKRAASLYLVQRIRDEAHRFAITFHRKLRGKRNLVSVLDHIVGVGPKRRQALWTHFGTLDKIKAASVDELASVPGMNRPSAEAVVHFFEAQRELRGKQ